MVKRCEPFGPAPIGRNSPRMTALRIADAVWKRRYTAASAVVISAALSLDAATVYRNRKNTRIATGATHGERLAVAPMVRMTVRNFEAMRSNTVASY